MISIIFYYTRENEKSFPNTAKLNDANGKQTSWYPVEHCVASQKIEPIGKTWVIINITYATV